MNTHDKVASQWLITPDMHGLRADQYLKRYIGRISRSRVQRIILAQDFLIDDQAIKPSGRVRNGQRAILKRFAPDQKNDIDSFSVEILFENDDLLVINKPPGLSIHPSANCLYKTLTHWLRTNYPGQKINPCHRIDKETSGIVVCAKNRAAESHVKKGFMHGKVQKTYLAIVSGVLLKAHTINIPLGLQKDRGLVAIRMIEDSIGKSAITKTRPLLVDKTLNRTLVLCHPLTGRQHQIRAHLSLIGHGIVADKLYSLGDEFFDGLSKGREELLKDLEHTRHALHASRVRLSLKGQRFVFKCPIPEDFYGLMTNLNR
jgi:23S rRNA pseudouridine1911/1915/1917 synthase